MKKIAIITTHPIQYNAPLFAMLHTQGNINVKVFYTWGIKSLQKKYDPGFDKIIEWDIPLLEGYDYEFLENAAKQKGSHHFNGIINPDILKKIIEYHPDAILVYGWKFNSHLKVLRYFKNKIPLWFRGDSILLNSKNKLRSLLKNIALIWVYKHVAKAFYTGTNNKIYFEKNGLRPSQLIAAFHAVDNKRFYNTGNRYTEGALKIRREMGIRENDFVFLFAGKLTPTKDIGNLIKSYKNIVSKNAHLIIVGNGPEEYKLKNNYPEVKNLHFLNFQNQATMPVVYQCCDVFVLPSIGETWGLSINEAMASGKAILASNKCGGAIDLIKDGENGYIFKAGDTTDLILKMQHIMSSREKLLQMQADSIKKIQNFSFYEFVIAIQKLFEIDNE